MKVYSKAEKFFFFLDFGILWPLFASASYDCEGFNTLIHWDFS